MSLLNNNLCVRIHGHLVRLIRFTYYWIQEFKGVLQNVPEIAEVVGNDYANQVLDISCRAGEEKLKAVLRSIFTRLMSASNEVISKAISKLKSRLSMASLEPCPYPPLFHRYSVICVQKILMLGMIMILLLSSFHSMNIWPSD